MHRIKTTCKKCNGLGYDTILFAPNPAQERVFKPQQVTCDLCNGMGATFKVEKEVI